MKKTEPQQQVNVSINVDTTPILYTDNINMVSNANGVVLNVMQNIGQPNEMRIVSRIGMSREHAKEFVEQLGRLLLLTGAETRKPKAEMN